MNHLFLLDQVSRRLEPLVYKKNTEFLEPLSVSISRFLFFKYLWNEPAAAVHLKAQ